MNMGLFGVLHKDNTYLKHTRAKAGAQKMYMDTDINVII